MTEIDKHNSAEERLNSKAGVIYERQTGSVMLCQIFIGPKFQNFTLKGGFYAWRLASYNFDCFPEFGKKSIAKDFWSLSKNEEKLT